MANPTSFYAVIFPYYRGVSGRGVSKPITKYVRDTWVGCAEAACRDCFGFVDENMLVYRLGHANKAKLAAALRNENFWDVESLEQPFGQVYKFVSIKDMRKTLAQLAADMDKWAI